MLDEAQRHELLAAMGVDVYVRRGAAETARAAAAGNFRVAVLCGKQGAQQPRAALLRKALPLALGCERGRIDWFEFADIDHIELPAAPVCLLLGADVARAANAQLANAQHGAVVVAVADAPHLSLHDALAKRALWQALKPIARLVHQPDG
ncbi:MAG: hypothetical protein WBV39_16375 [Rudaea sp.]